MKQTAICAEALPVLRTSVRMADYAELTKPRIALLVLFTVAVGALLAFTLRCARHPNALVPPALFRVRAFTGASFVATVFSIAFGAMLLSIVLWEQTVWGWSALATGAAIAPGPLMVPVFAFGIAGRAIARWGPAAVSAVGAAAFAAGVAWWAFAVEIEPNYVSGMLPGMLLTGIGVGLTLPTYMATAAGSLPAPSFATGSAVVNMLRQIGLAVGVAILVAVLGSAVPLDARLHAFQRGWVVIASLSLASAIVGAVALPGRARAPVAQAPPAMALEAE